MAEREVDKLQFGVIKAKRIKNREGLEEATGFLLEIKAVSKGIADKKNPIIKGLNDSIKEIRALFEPAEDRLFQAEGSVKSSILEYNMRVEEKAEREAAKIEKKVDEGKMKLSTGMGKISNIEQASQPVQTKSGSVQFRTIKRIKITDVSKLKVYMMRPRVQEAMRIEIVEDVRKGMSVPDGAEQYEEKVVAGVGG